VLPGDLASTEKVLSFIAGEISPATYVNLMDQYHPCHRAHDFPPLERPVSGSEFRRAREIASRFGLREDRDRRWAFP
jgi:putative pyruvate formate lyase activating enzyme